MLPKPRADLKPNTADFERFPLVKPTGFREYDARWLYPQEINLMGLNAVGERLSGKPNDTQRRMIDLGLSTGRSDGDPNLPRILGGQAVEAER